MKRNLLVLIIITLLALAVITACSPKATAPTAAPANSTAPTAYPAKQEPAVQSAATAYPAMAPTAAPATTDKLTDEQIVALIEKQLNDHHTMDFLLSKNFTADQWVTVLNNESHNDVLFTPAELEQVVAYLIAHQK
ncbi:MAG TPA: hypothetical protein VLR89_01020 [Anaerolineaceae bacterium]|nr:hypothetical protein [Anaerolineaceae bacterium]